MALDTTNNRLYVANGGAGTVAQVNNVGGTPTVVAAYAARATSPRGWRWTRPTTASTSPTTHNTVAQVNNLGGTPTVVAAYAAGFNQPFGVALDAANNRLYVTNANGNTVAQVNNVGGTPTVVAAYATGFSSPSRGGAGSVGPAAPRPGPGAASSRVSPRRAGAS